MTNEAFKRNFSKLLAKVGDKAELAVRKTALDLFSAMVVRSPVDTGRFRSNWIVGIDSIDMDIGAAIGSDPNGKAKGLVASWNVGQTIFMTNSLPYSRPLELGSSKQAPSGMVRITIAEYSQYLKTAVASMK